MYLAFETQPCDISAVTGKTPLPLVGGIPFPKNLNWNQSFLTSSQ